MDIISHGLWGAVAFGRKNRKSFWLSFLAGVLPDFLAFGWFFAGSFLGFFDHPTFSSGQHPAPEEIPQFVHNIYNVTHSLVVFLVVFLVVWAIRKKPFWELSGWGLHILFDIPTHVAGFFPTPFLWPIADVVVDGKSWGSPIIFIPNVLLLLLLYGWFGYKKYRFNRGYSGSKTESAEY